MKNKVLPIIFSFTLSFGLLISAEEKSPILLTGHTEPFNLDIDSTIEEISSESKILNTLDALNKIIAKIENSLELSKKDAKTLLTASLIASHGEELLEIDHSSAEFKAIKNKATNLFELFREINQSEPIEQSSAVEFLKNFEDFKISLNLIQDKNKEMLLSNMRNEYVEHERVVLELKKSNSKFWKNAQIVSGHLHIMKNLRQKIAILGGEDSLKVLKEERQQKILKLNEKDFFSEDLDYFFHMKLIYQNFYISHNFPSEKTKQITAQTMSCFTKDGVNIYKLEDIIREIKRKFILSRPVLKAVKDEMEHIFSNKLIKSFIGRIVNFIEDKEFKEFSNIIVLEKILEQIEAWGSKTIFLRIKELESSAVSKEIFVSNLIGIIHDELEETRINFLNKRLIMQRNTQTLNQEKVVFEIGISNQKKLIFTDLAIRNLIEKRKDLSLTKEELLSNNFSELFFKTYLIDYLSLENKFYNEMSQIEILNKADFSALMKTKKDLRYLSKIYIAQTIFDSLCKKINSSNIPQKSILFKNFITSIKEESFTIGQLSRKTKEILSKDSANVPPIKIIQTTFNIALNHEATQKKYYSMILKELTYYLKTGRFKDSETKKFELLEKHGILLRNIIRYNVIAKGFYLENSLNRKYIDLLLQKDSAQYFLQERTLQRENSTDFCEEEEFELYKKLHTVMHNLTTILNGLTMVKTAIDNVSPFFNHNIDYSAPKNIQTLFERFNRLQVILTNEDIKQIKKDHELSKIIFNDEITSKDLNKMIKVIFKDIVQKRNILEIQEQLTKEPFNLEIFFDEKTVIQKINKGFIKGMGFHSYANTVLEQVKSPKIEDLKEIDQIFFEEIKIMHNMFKKLISSIKKRNSKFVSKPIFESLVIGKAQIFQEKDI